MRNILGRYIIHKTAPPSPLRNGKKSTYWQKLSENPENFPGPWQKRDKIFCLF